MRRSDAALAAAPTPVTSLVAIHARRTLQVIADLQDVCPSEVAGDSGASDVSFPPQAAVDLDVLVSTAPLERLPIDAAAYRVSVTFTIAAEELEEFVSRHLGHPCSTDVRIEAVSNGR